MYLCNEDGFTPIVLTPVLVMIVLSLTVVSEVIKSFNVFVVVVDKLRFSEEACLLNNTAFFN